MGRGMLLTCVLMVSIYSIIMLNMQERRKQIVKGTANTAESVQAHNAAHSGLQLYINDFKEAGWDFRNLKTPKQYNLNKANVRVEAKTPTNSSMSYNKVKLIAQSEFRGETKKIQALLTSNFPTPKGAMAFYGKSKIDFNADGNAFQINGHDTDPSGVGGTAPDIPGVVTKSTNAMNGFKSGLQNHQEDNIKGKGGSPSTKVDQTLDLESLQQLTGNWTSKADRVIQKSKNNKSKKPIKISNATLGSRNNPEITVIKDDVRMSGNSSGYGILIVQDNAKLTVTGNFDYKGMVIHNSRNMEIDARGNTKIHGAVMHVPPSSSGNCKVLQDDGTVYEKICEQEITSGDGDYEYKITDYVYRYDSPTYSYNYEYNYIYEFSPGNQNENSNGNENESGNCANFNKHNPPLFDQPDPPYNYDGPYQVQPHPQAQPNPSACGSYNNNYDQDPNTSYTANNTSKVNLSGNIDTYYSSEKLMNVQNKFGGSKLDIRYTVDNVYE